MDGEQKWVEKLRLHNKYNDKNQLIQQLRLLPEKTITTAFGYDSNGRLTTYNSGAGYNSTLTYDALSRLSTVTDRTNKRTYSYADGAGENTTTTRVSQVSYTGTSAGTGFTPLTYTYTYDSRGNILTITDPISGNRSYTYDALGQMTKEVINGTTYTYAYDKVGNLTSYNGKALTYTHSSWQDLLTSFDGHNCSYDTMGNPTSYHNGVARWVFTWDGRELKTAQLKGTTNPSSYSYDENGLRTTKTVVSASGTTTHTYLYAADGTLIREIVDNPNGTTDTMEFLYDHAGQPYSFVLNNVMYFYVVNLQGDVVRIVDMSGRTVASYVYNAWRKQISATPNTSLANAANVTNKNPLRYRGYYYDTETKLYYLQSRYYNPEMGRFINADALVSTGQGILGNNMFAYCGNNPIQKVDTCGHMPTDAQVRSCYYNGSGDKNGWIQLYMDLIKSFELSGVTLFYSKEAAISAWSAKYLPLSRENEYVTFLYSIETTFGTRYYTTQTFRGTKATENMPANVIFGTIMLAIQDQFSSSSLVAHVHTHPDPGVGYHNDFPSASLDIRGGDRIAYELLNLPEMYIIPYTRCHNTPAIITYTDRSTWCTHSPY